MVELLSMDEYVRRYYPDYTDSVDRILVECNESIEKYLIAQGWVYPVKKAPQKKRFIARHANQVRLPLVGVKKVQKGRCKGCNGEYDDYTEGCDNCASRHGMRRNSKRLAS